MLNIPKINLFQITSPRKEQSNTGVDFRGINTSKLAPLAQDTISFGANKANLNKSLYDAFDNIDVCTQVYKDAVQAEKNLKKTLTTALESLVYDRDENPHGMIFKISTRIKEPDSIKEKVAGELEYAIIKDKTKIFSPLDPKEIKTALGDIVGARVTLRKSDNAQNSKMIDALIEEIKKGNLKITKIQNYEPEKISENLKYFEQSELKRLLDAVNQYRKPGTPEVKLFNIPKKTGYMALHLDVDLSNDDFATRNDNYKGEIQIVGYDVEKLKDVEDLCYKLRHDKALKGGHPAYSTFSQYYKKFSTTGDAQKDEELKQAFIEYTSRAFIIQRQKEPINAITNERTKKALPTIGQCGLTGKVPPELDFNRLALIKKRSDELYEVTKNM